MALLECSWRRLAVEAAGPWCLDTDSPAAATKPGDETMCTSASRNWPVGVCALKPEPKEAPGPNQLPVEMLREVLSYLPPRTLLGHCRPVCRRWRDLVDAWYLWRSILPWKHPNLWPVIRTCLPPADDPGPCILGRFCERRPIGRNLLRNPQNSRGLGGEPRKGSLWELVGGRERGRYGKDKKPVPGQVGWLGTQSPSFFFFF